jgi:hypothetical protein
MHTITRRGKAACAILPGAVEQRRQERGFDRAHAMRPYGFNLLIHKSL